MVFFTEETKERPMKAHARKILEWADRRDRPTSLREISKETGVPVMSVHYILSDYENKGDDSILSKYAKMLNYDIEINKEWNQTEKYKRRKMIIVSRKRGL